MFKKLIASVVVTVIVTTGAQALDKELSYKVINQCKYEVDKSGKYDSTVAGIIIGLSQAYVNTLKKSGIDNDYAALTVDDYGTEMCKFALYNRKEENKKTGGKYDVTGFYEFLINVGYYMTLPQTNDTNTTN